MRERIEPLTSLRFFAALSIIGWHLTATHWISGELASKFQLYDGVSFFYVLSGFILQFSYREKIADIGGIHFFLLRFARIWPLHIVIVLLLLALGHQTTLKQFVAVATLTQSWIPNQNYYFGLNGVAWSISDELFFYACFPFLTYFVRKWPAAVFVTTGVLLVAYLKLVPDHGRPDQINGLFSISPLVRLPEFILGMIVYEIRFKIDKLSLIRSLSVDMWTAFELVLIGAVLVENYLIPSWGNTVWRFGQAGAVTWFFSAGTAPAFAAMILVFSFAKGAISRSISCKPLVLLGDISFSIYLVHQSIMFRFPPGHLLPLPAVLAVILAVSYVAWVLIEMPTHRFARSLIGSRSPKPKGVALT